MKTWLLPFVLGLFAVWALTHVYIGSGFPFTHDGENHLARFANYAMAVREGQLPPRFAPNLQNHYGYPVFNYNYPLANIASLPFTLLRINPEVTFAVIVTLAVILCVLGSVFWWVALTGSWSSAGLAPLLVGSNFFLATTIVFRGSIGEVVASACLPWVGAALEQSRKHAFSLGWWLVLVGSLTCLSLSHNISVLLAVPALVIYACLRLPLRDIKMWISLLSASAVATGASLWFWLPALAEKSAIVLDGASNASQVLAHFVTWSQLWTSPIRFGFSYPGSIDTLSLNMGVSYLVVILLGVFLLWRERHDAASTWIRWWWLGAVVLLWLQMQSSSWVWHLAWPVLRYVQFPWRLALLSHVFLLPLTSWIWIRADRFAKMLLLSCLMWQLLVVGRLVPVDRFHKQLVDYQFFSQSTSTNNENTPQQFHWTTLGDWQPAPQVFPPAVEQRVTLWRGSYREYTLTTTASASLVIEPTSVFPGWQTENNTQHITYVDSSTIAGRLAFEVPAGKHAIKTRFTQHTWPRLVGNSVSLLTLCGLGVFMAIKGLRARKQQR